MALENVNNINILDEDIEIDDGKVDEKDYIITTVNLPKRTPD
ncbi:18438_t:CDS:2 [Rhizophagus irregularis]|nr:18438_t:CDS:2 [Rhizophagus irregularis]